MNPDPSIESTPKEKISLELPQGAWKENRPQKIRGALILVAFGLFMSLIQNLGYFIGSIGPIIGSRQWDRFTNPGSPEFHPYWKLALICEGVTATLILFWNLVMLVFFFRKKRVFPVLVAASTCHYPHFDVFLARGCGRQHKASGGALRGTPGMTRNKAIEPADAGGS